MHTSRKSIFKHSLMAAALMAALLPLSACQIAPTITEAPPTEARATTAPTNTALPQPTEAPPTTAPAESPTPSAPETAARLDPLTIPKFVEPLVIPPVMPSEGVGDYEGQGEQATNYRIAVRQFQQQMLPTGYPMTTVFGYGRASDPSPGSGEASTFNAPAFTVEVRRGEQVRVEWINQLVDDPASGSPQFLPHLLPVDQTVLWANPLGEAEAHGSDPTSYLGPVPIVTHVHGARVPTNSDGFPQAWYLPDAANLPENIKPQGRFYDSVFEAPAGAAVFEYPNDQPATTLWYHDHVLGMTRLNVYAGMAGFWLIRDDVEDALNLPGPAPKASDAPGTRYYEIPMVIQDRSFNEDGSLFYPDSREFFDGYTGPYAPETTVSPIWNPEFFGDTMTVNGRTWPYLEVEPRLYRFRIVNGNDSRFLVLKFDQDILFNQIGSEGGLLPGAPLQLNQLLMGPAERADVIVDFSQFAPGDEITLLNLGPDSPFGGLPVDPAEQANPETTGQVIQFRVVELTDQGNPGEIPASLPPIDRLQTDLPERDVTLNEIMYAPADIPVEAELGTDRDGAISFDHDVTENPEDGSVELWRIINLTADSHPIHLHLVMFQVVDRTPFDAEAYAAAQQEYITDGQQGDPPDPMDFATGDPIPANSWEMGWKDTVIANPGELTRIVASYDVSDLYVWHCHILEHEDNEMMRPYHVGQIPPDLHFTEDER